MKIFQCDGNQCDEKNYTPNCDGWLIIGSENQSSLTIVNNLPDRWLISMHRHADLHFCSKQCFVNRFLMTENFQTDAATTTNRTSE